MLSAHSSFCESARRLLNRSSPDVCLTAIISCLRMNCRTAVKFAPSSAVTLIVITRDGNHLPCNVTVSMHLERMGD